MFLFLHLLVNRPSDDVPRGEEPSGVNSSVKENGPGKGSSPFSFFAAEQAADHAARPSSSSSTAPTPRTASEMRRGERLAGGWMELNVRHVIHACTCSIGQPNHHLWRHPGWWSVSIIVPPPCRQHDGIGLEGEDSL